MPRCPRKSAESRVRSCVSSAKAAGAYFLYLLQNIRKAPGFAEEPLKRGRRCLRSLSCRRLRAPEKRPCHSSGRGTSPSRRRGHTARNRPRPPGLFRTGCRAPGYFRIRRRVLSAVQLRRAARLSCLCREARRERPPRRRAALLPRGRRATESPLCAAQRLQALGLSADSPRRRFYICRPLRF